MCIYVYMCIYIHIHIYIYISVLQSAAVCCSALQCVAVRCSMLQCVAVHILSPFFRSEGRRQYGAGTRHTTCPLSCCTSKCWLPYFATDGTSRPLGPSTVARFRRTGAAVRPVNRDVFSLRCTLFAVRVKKVSVCCSVLQCVAVCGSVLPCVAVCSSVLQCVAVCCHV